MFLGDKVALIVSCQPRLSEDIGEISFPFFFFFKVHVLLANAIDGVKTNSGLYLVPERAEHALICLERVILLFCLKVLCDAWILGTPTNQRADKAKKQKQHAP